MPKKSKHRELCSLTERIIQREGIVVDGMKTVTENLVYRGSFSRFYRCFKENGNDNGNRRNGNDKGKKIRK